MNAMRDKVAALVPKLARVYSHLLSRTGTDRSQAKKHPPCKLGASDPPGSQAQAATEGLLTQVTSAVNQDNQA